MTSIWDNDFYETPPQPLYAFEVDFMQYNDLDSSAQTLLTKAIKSCSIKERNLNLARSYYGGLEFRHAARPEAGGELSITFNENQNLDVTTALNRLFNKQSYNEEWAKKTDADSTAFRESLNDNKIVLKILKPDNYTYSTDSESYSKKFTYCHCILMNIGEVEFSYDAEEAMEIQVSFSYNYMLTE